MVHRADCGARVLFLPHRWCSRFGCMNAWRGVSAVRRFVASLTILALSACQSDPVVADRTLAQGLQVAEVALAAGQPDVARKLYQSLAKRHPGVPAPLIRLAQIAFEQSDFGTAREYFREAAGMPATERARAQAWYGAGRAALALEDGQDAKAHFLRARAHVTAPEATAWIVNGMAVAATLEADLEGAVAHYEEALALDPDNARIVANYVRVLVESGQVEKAATAYAAREPSFWPDDDEQRLRVLIREHW